MAEFDLTLSDRVQAEEAIILLLSRWTPLTLTPPIYRKNIGSVSRLTMLITAPMETAWCAESNV
jgi:hypothetical protein